MKQTQLKKGILWALTLLTAMTIFLFSSQNAVESGGLSGALTKGLLELFPAYRALAAGARQAVFDFAQEALRSGAHWFVFFCLGLFAALLAREYPLRRPFLTAFCACALYAVSDELYQGFFSPGRACELADMLKDWSGSGAAAALTMLCARKGRRQRLP